jgi:hypothetical protein
LGFVNTNLEFGYYAIPATEFRSASLKEKCSMAKREASGEVGLWEGGVGRDADGAA